MLLMSKAGIDHKFAQVVHKIDPQAKLLRSWALQGGISAQMMALELLRGDGRSQKLIVRRPGDHAVHHNLHAEFRVLQILRSAGVPVPQPYAFGPERRDFPHALPGHGIHRGPARLCPGGCQCIRDTDGRATSPDPRRRRRQA